jgi:outer membrane protein
VELGDAFFKERAAKQLSAAAGSGLDAQLQETLHAAAAGYFDLIKAQAAAGVARDAVRIAKDLADQVRRGVEAGVAFKGDALRAEVQFQRNQLALRQAEEQVRASGARLAQTLHLDVAAAVTGKDDELLPLELVSTNSALGELVGQALAQRPEVKQSVALVRAAESGKDGATIGPLVPALGAQAFFAGLGGGKNGSARGFAETEDYIFGLSWRIGPGGLFDRSRIAASDARVKSAKLSQVKVEDDIVRQVVEAHNRLQSQADQLVTARRALAAAEEGLKLARERKEFAVGIVLENIQAEQELTRSRLDFATSIAEFNKAQYALRRAVGGLNPGENRAR